MVILDPNSGWVAVTQLLEGRRYVFDARGTLDDSLVVPQDLENFTFSWDFGNGRRLGPGKGGAPDGLLNVTHSYSRVGVYRVNLTAQDPARNIGVSQLFLLIQAESGSHPDLFVRPGSLVLSPPVPAALTEVVVRVEVGNRPDRSVAGSIRAAFATLDRGRATNLTVLRLRVTAPTSGAIEELESGEQGTLELVVLAPASPGSYDFRLRVWDVTEPPAWIDGANEILTRTTVITDVSVGVLPTVALTAVAVVVSVLLLRRMDRGRRRRIA